MANNWLEKIFMCARRPPAVEWKTSDSIFNVLSNSLDGKGRLKETAHDLPDENKNEGNGRKIRYAPGLLDTLAGADDSKGLQRRIKPLLKLLKRVAVKGDAESGSEFYREITENADVISIIDAFLQAIADESLPIKPHLFEFAKDLAFRTNHRNSVKFGIAILGLCQDKSVIGDLMILGLHDEFTVYSAIAVSGLSDRPVRDLWELAKKVDGWGKIQLVSRLAVLDLPDDIKDWLIREGYKNSIEYGYLAFTCADRGLLHEKLESEKIDKELFKASGEIIEALIAGGPAEDISDYVHASTAVENYIRHAKEHVDDIADFLVLSRIKDFLAGLLNDIGEHKENGWTGDGISDCLIEIAGMLDGRNWKSQAVEGLKSREALIYWNAKEAAGRLGIDIWDTVWQRLLEDPTDFSAWYDVTHSAEPGKADQIIEFALGNLPLDEYASGPEDLLGLGPKYNKFHCLDEAIVFLENHPGKGEKIILTGLKSPVTRNRNMAIRVLDKWKRKNWSEEIEGQLKYLKNIEPNQDTKRNVERLLNGQALE